MSVRNVNAIRPWQHIFDVVHAYLLIAQFTMKNSTFHNWNVAPHNSNISVYDIMRYFFGTKFIKSNKNNKKRNIEKKELQLDSKKIKTIIKWQPRHSFNLMMKDISKWYDLYYKKKNVKEYSIKTADLFLKKILNKN